MPGIDPYSLAIGGTEAAVKLGLAAVQANKAAGLKFADTTTPEQREALAIARQRASSLNVPGQAMQQGRLMQAQNAAIQAAQLGSGSGTDLLTASAAANKTQQNGELQLGVQRQQYLTQADAGLQQQLGLQAQQRQRDLATYNNTKSELLGSAIKNASNAVDTGAAYAAYGADKAANTPTGFGDGAVDQLTPRSIGLTPMAAPMSAPGIRGTGLPGYTPALTGGRYASSRYRYGLPY